jgi:transcriptional regulator with XRE-family HTH domain
VTDNNRLGDYLRARRALVTPDEAGVARSGVRRVAGLRREEVALLAGISSDYYVRLEQGRNRHPSAQVLRALARVLRLDAEAVRYLLSLADEQPGGRQVEDAEETVPPSIRHLLTASTMPVFVEGRTFDVLAANSFAQTLSPNVRVGENRLRSVFLDPAERALYPDWEEVTARHVAAFRASVGTATDDARATRLIHELSASSERFRRLWARHDVEAREGMPIRIRHPEVGGFEVWCDKLAIGGAPGLTLVIYHAQPGTASADKLAILGTLAAGSATARSRNAR